MQGGRAGRTSQVKESGGTLNDVTRSLLVTHRIADSQGVGKIGVAGRPPDPPTQESWDRFSRRGSNAPGRAPHHPCRLLMEESTSAGKESLKMRRQALCKSTSSVPGRERVRGGGGFADVRGVISSTNGDRYLYDHLSVHVLFVAGDVAINVSDPEARQKGRGAVAYKNEIVHHGLRQICLCGRK